MNRQPHFLRFRRRKSFDVLGRTDRRALLSRANFRREPSGLFFKLLDLSSKFFARLLPKRVDIRSLAELYPREKSLHRIEVLRRDRIEFVIVTTRTTDAESEKRFPRVRYDLRELILTREAFGLFILSDLSRQEHRRSDEKSGRSILSECIPGKLLLNESIVGQIAVERFDDVVPIRPGVGALGVHLETVSVGIADDVEPMLGPSLPMPRRCQEPVDNGCTGVFTVVREEFFEFFWCRRKTGEIESRPSQPGDPACFGRGRKTVLFELLENEGIDRILAPIRTIESRDTRPLHRSERPVVGPILHLRVVDAIGPHGTFFDPLSQYRHRVRRQRIALRRHSYFFVFAAHESEQGTRPGFMGNEIRRMAAATAKGCLFDIEPQA